MKSAEENLNELLIKAVNDNNSEILKSLISSNQYFIDKTYDCLPILTPLQYAVKINHERAVQMLLELGADVNQESAYYETSPPKEEEMWDDNPHIEIATRFTALHQAAELGFCNITRQLLNAGADVNAQTFNYDRTYIWTPICLAVLAGHLEMVQILLDAGARLDLDQHTEHKSPLGAAEHNRHSEIVKLLRNTLRNAKEIREQQ